MKVGDNSVICRSGSGAQLGLDLLRAFQCISWQRFSQLLCKFFLFV
jgi:hypothetical protein